MDIKELALLFHETYERLAPSFGYETRPDTKKFDPESPNGKLMCAVVSEFLAAYLAEQEPVAWVPQFSWQRSIDAVACISKRSFDDIPLYAAPLAHERERCAVELEQQNAELVAALKLCKKHMAGDKWDSLFIDGVLSKVKQP